jgi:hypothetical protein
MSRTISYTLTEQELVAVHRRQYLRRCISRRGLGQVALCVAVVWLIAFGANFLSAGYTEAARSATTFCGTILTIMPLMILLGYGLTGYGVRRLFRQQRAIREACEATWSEEGLEVRSTSVTSMPWTDFHGWRSDVRGYLVYINEASFILLPRRSFADAQWDDLGEILAKSGPRRDGGTTSADRHALDAGSHARRRWRMPWSRPGRIAGLWVILTILDIAHTMLFPDNRGGMVSATLFFSGTPIFAALLASAALGLRAATLGLIAMLLSVATGFEAASFASEFLRNETIDAALWIVSMLAVAGATRRGHHSGNRCLHPHVFFRAGGSDVLAGVRAGAVVASS